MGTLPNINFDYQEIDVSIDTNSGSEIILATGGYDHSIILWQAHTGSILSTLNHPYFQVNQLTIHPQQPHLFSATKGEIRKYNLATTRKDPELIFDSGKSRNITGIDIQKNGSWMASCSDDGQVHIWCLKDQGRSQVMNRIDENHKYNLVKIHPNQVHLYLARDKSDIVLWDLRNNKTLVVTPKLDPNDILTSRNVRYTSFAVEPYSSALAVTSLYTKSVFKLVQKSSSNSPPETTSTEIDYEWDTNFVVDNSRDFIHTLHCTFSYDSTLFACSYSDGSAAVYNTNDGTPFLTLSDETCNDWVWDCEFTPDSRYMFTACADGNIRLWSLETCTKVREYVGHRGCVTSLAFRD